MMRKNQHTFYILAACTVLLSGCARVLEEDLEEQMPTFRSKYICFVAASGDIATKSSPADAPVSFMTEEDWPVGTPTTKGNPTTAFSGNASITGYLYSGDWAGTETPWATLYDKSFSFNGSVLNAVADPVPWVKAQSVNPKLRVYAYAPADFAATMSSSSAPGAPTLTYEVPSDVGDQKDLIVATGDALCADKTSVPLTFSHALTAVKFNVDFACTVKSIEVQGVYTHGVYTIGDAWSSVGTEGDFTIDLGSGVGCKKGSSVTDGANTLMMIPQTVPAGAQVVMTYDEGSGDQTLTASIAGNTWTAGKRVTYTLSKEAPNYIYFDLAAGHISIKNVGGTYKYTGAVYINTASGSPTVKAVTGTHSESNEYYVFQSSTITDSPGYHKGWTGDVSSDGKIPAEGSLMELPTYSEVMSPDGSKTWSEYITNNKHSEDIIGLWSDIPNHPLTKVKRTSTNNALIFVAAAAAGPLNINMTFDNVWDAVSLDKLPSPQDRTLSTEPGVETAFLLLGNDNENIGMTLKLKGDNFFHEMQFDTRKTDDYFRITSYEGDGSKKYSLTVTASGEQPKAGGVGCYAGLCSVQTRQITQYGFSIGGGTIYCATPLYLWSDATSKSFNCLGAGANSNVVMEIDGGCVTAVCHGTGAAIGGGGGFDYVGGDGFVTISGGEVYAYQFGTTTNASSNRYPVTSTAIGGGSTFRAVANSGQVTIKGNAYVYAESVGGVAIGGGSSGGLTGGAANINIEGNPTIIAKSVPGAIHDHWRNVDHVVTAGTAIGGGNGGDEKYKMAGGYSGAADAIATGGDAEVNVSGGKIYTGSFGGGKNGCSSSGEARTLGTARITITGGNVQGQFIMAAGAAIAPFFNMSGGTINNRGLLEASGFYKVRDNGGAVYIGTGSNPGSFTMSAGTITNCSAVSGGIVYQEDGSCTITGGSLLASNASQKGGAVYIAGEANPTFTMSGGEISGCNADSDGGAVYLEGGSVTITEGIIRRNKALGGSGGGICINKGSFTMSDGAINGNYADLNGGGVFISSVDTDVTATVSGGTITENTSEKWGGGLCILPGGVSAANVTLGVVDQGHLNPDISGNRSKFAGGGVYTAGANAHITINSGKINGNQVTAYVANENVANEGGMVTLLDGDVTHQVVTFHANGSGAFFDANGDHTQNGSEGTEKIQKIVTSTNSTLVAPTDYYFAGFHFNGWNSRPDGLGETYTNGQVMNITENVDLYIQWEID